jgi:pilus assembly protein Flp/PilA
MTTLLRRLFQEEQGQDLIEYALLAAFIALASVLAMTNLGFGIRDLFAKVTGKLTAIP